MDFGLAALNNNNNVGNNNNNDIDMFGWYMEIPIISRTYLTGAFLTTAACAIELISPFSLYYNATLIFVEGQLWR